MLQHNVIQKKEASPKIRIFLQPLRQTTHPPIKSLYRHILITHRSLSRIYPITNILRRQQKAASEIL